MISGAHLSTLLGNWRAGWILWGLLFGFLLFVVSGLGYAAAARLGLSPPAEASLFSDLAETRALLLVILVVILAVLEEWLFRGIVLDFLQSKSAVLAVIGSAVVFALYHLSLFQLLPTLLLGLGLAVIVVYFGALWAGPRRFRAFLLHVTNTCISIATFSLFLGPGHDNRSKASSRQA